MSFFKPFEFWRKVCLRPGQSACQISAQPLIGWQAVDHPVFPAASFRQTKTLIDDDGQPENREERLIQMRAAYQTGIARGAFCQIRLQESLPRIRRNEVLLIGVGQDISQITSRVAQPTVFPVNQTDPAIRPLDNIGKARIGPA